MASNLRTGAVKPVRGPPSSVSAEEFFSIPETDDPSSSSTIRLPSATFDISNIINNPFISPPPLPHPSSPPPPALPPKPSFARSDTFIVHPSPTLSRDTTTTPTTNPTFNLPQLASSLQNQQTRPPPLPPKPDKWTNPTSQNKQYDEDRDDFGLASATVLDTDFNLSNLLNTQPVQQTTATPFPDIFPFPPDRKTEPSDTYTVPYPFPFPDRDDTDLDPDPYPVRLLTAEAFAATTAIRIPGTQLLASVQSFGDGGVENTFTLKLPFPTPPFTACDRAVSMSLLPLNSIVDHDKYDRLMLKLSEESTEDVHIGAIVLNRSRLKHSQRKQQKILESQQQSSQQQQSQQQDLVMLNTTSQLLPPASSQSPPPLPPPPTKPLPPLPALSPSSSFPRLTKPSLHSTSSLENLDHHQLRKQQHMKKGHVDDIWTVLRDYLTNTSLGAQGRARALHELALTACCNVNGEAILTEIVNRMRGTERSERDGSVFTLLIHVATCRHNSKVRRARVLNVFSNVVEEMHGRQDDHVMWERALKCFLILTGKGEALASVSGLSMSFSSSSNNSRKLQYFADVNLQQYVEFDLYDQYDYEYEFYQEFLNHDGRRVDLIDGRFVYEGEDEDEEEEGDYDNDDGEEREEDVGKEKEDGNDGDHGEGDGVVGGEGEDSNNNNEDDDNDGNGEDVDEVTTKCMVALALHVGDVSHADVDRILITQGLCTRLRNNNNSIADDSNDSTLSTSTYTFTYSMNEKAVDDVGGIDVIASLFLNTPCMSARHTLFGIIFDIMIAETLESMNVHQHQRRNGANGEVENDLIMEDQVTVLRSFVHAYDIADLLVHSFRVGPWDTFVPDLMRLLLLQPLTNGLFSSSSSTTSKTTCDKQMEESNQKQKQIDTSDEESDEKQVQTVPKSKSQIAEHQEQHEIEQSEQQHNSMTLQQKQRNGTTAEKSYQDTLPSIYREAAKTYLSMVTTMVKYLDKSLFLRVLQRVQRMAQHQARLLHHREVAHHHLREWRILKTVENHIQDFHRHSFSNRYNNHSNNNINRDGRNSSSECGVEDVDVDDLLENIYKCSIEMTEECVSPRGIIKLVELIIELFTIKLPFSTTGKLYAGIHDQNIHHYHHHHHHHHYFHRNSHRNSHRSSNNYNNAYRYQQQTRQQQQRNSRPHHQKRNNPLHQQDQTQTQRQRQQQTEIASRDCIARLFLHGHVIAVRDMLNRTKPDLFTCLLNASRQHASVMRVSENRQCLIEFLGASNLRVSFLKKFTDDDDAAVAYRARELFSKYSDSSGNPV